MTATEPTALTGLHHVRLAVSDLGRARAFWEDLLGYEWEFDFPGEDGPAASALRHPAGGPNIVLWRDAAVAAATRGFVAFGVGLPDADAVESLRDRLDSRGIEHGGIQGAFVEVKLPFVATPDGALVSFYVKPDPARVATS